MSLSCPLCKARASFFHNDGKRIFHQCDKCRAIFCAPEYFPLPQEEKQRYLKHHNDVNDMGYRAFAEPLVSAVVNDFTPAHHGLDFGSGANSVVSHLLNERNFKIEQYDPFFSNSPELLKRTYDYIVCCEVIEHFHHPRKEFTLLKNLLLPGGKLYCMTDMYSEAINFEKWYYKNDSTHVIFYHLATLRWIKAAFGFSAISLQGRLSVFQN